MARGRPARSGFLHIGIAPTGRYGGRTASRHFGSFLAGS
jgi:hypothetical protein